MDWDEFEKEAYFEYMRQQHGGTYILYTEEEYEAMIKAAVVGYLEKHGEGTEDEIMEYALKVIRWAEGVALDHDFIQLMIKEMVYPASIEGEHTVPEFVFKVTALGQEVGEEIERRRRE